MRIIYNPIGSCASSCQRLIYPLMALAKAGKAEVEVINTNDIRSQLRKADLVVLQCLIGPEQHELIDYIHEQGKKIVIDYDDIMSDLPPRLLKNLGMNQKSITKNWLKYLKSADAITVPSYALAEKIQGMLFDRFGITHADTPVWVKDNFLPREVYEASKDYTPFDDSDEIRIMYSCSESHWDDFQFIGPILKELGEKHPNVTIISQGGLEFGYHFWDYKGKTRHEPKTSYGSYYSMLRRVKPHIFLAPLTSNMHNMCRSNLKYLQAGVVKAAFVGSYLEDMDKKYDGLYEPPYEDVINEVTGLVITKKSEWYATLSKLVEDPEMIKRIGLQTYDRMANYILEDHIDSWEAVYFDVLKK